MLNGKRLLEMDRKWQKASTLGRRRITCSTSVAQRGHLFVYSADGERFMISIAYLSSTILRELFRMSEEEFGLPSDGPITLPYDSSCTEYIVSLLSFQVSRDVERAVLTAVASTLCSASSWSLLRHERQNLVLSGF